ncbi:MAG: NYN domain-containing protein [Lentisphaerae bacterium]|nr:NYN domain-containing protein [Lentisphaerota bacterium]
MPEIDHKLVRIGVFYDGNFFYHVSNYYRYAHPRRQRISIPGLHEFIRRHVADAEGVDAEYAQIVDAHFFRGRLWAREAEARQQLYAERVFDDILMAEGVVTHYLPIPQKTEKGIDVWLALEAFELTVYKKFNVVVLLAGDSDFIPLARKINSLGTRMMVLGWDFKFTDDSGRERETVTSTRLLDEITYPVMMHQIIDDKANRDDPVIRNLFVEHKESPVAPPPITRTPEPDDPAQADPDGLSKCEGELLSLRGGFGFIRCRQYPNNVFFHWASLENKDFSELAPGQRVRFFAEEGERGPVAREIEVLD